MDEVWISVEEVAELLGVKTRQAHRYGEGNTPRIRTKMVAGRKLFHRGNTATAAAEKQATQVARPKPPKTELVPVGEMLTYIRERDRHVEDLQRQLTEAAATIGYLRGQLEQRLLPEDAAKLRERVEELERERNELKAQLTPWWRRILRMSS